VIDRTRVAIIKHVKSVTRAFALKSENLELEWREEPRRSCLEIRKGSLYRPVCFSVEELQAWTNGSEIPGRLRTEIFKTVSWLDDALK
jgi:hypothetical protein